jgi:hypothetical protein
MKEIPEDAEQNTKSHDDKKKDVEVFHLENYNEVIKTISFSFKQQKKK